MGISKQTIIALAVPMTLSQIEIMDIFIPHYYVTGIL